MLKVRLRKGAHKWPQWTRKVRQAILGTDQELIQRPLVSQPKMPTT